MAYKLLIVDDEITITNGLKTIIEKSGLEFSGIYTASSGSESMGIINSVKPDIVLTDIKMPDMDGLDLIEHVCGKMRKKPVFAIISGYDDFKYTKRGIKCGVYDYLLKPVRKNELLQMLSDIIEKLDVENRERNEYIQRQVSAKEGTDILIERYLNLLVQPERRDVEFLRNKLSTLGVRFCPGLYRVLAGCFKFKTSSGMKAFDETAMFAFKNIVDESLCRTVKGFWSFYDSKGKLILLVSQGGDCVTDSCVRDIAKTIGRNVMKYMGADVFIGAGMVVDGLYELDRSYCQAVEATKYKIAETSGGLMLYGNMAEQSAGEGFNMPFILKLVNYVEQNRRSEIITLIEDEFERLNSLKASVCTLEKLYCELNRYIYNTFVYKYGNCLSAFTPGGRHFTDYDCFWSLEELKSHIKHCVLELCGSICLMRSQNYNRRIIDQVLAYINDNYNKDISLNSISCHFNKCESYLSMLFKKETGKNFIDYLTSLRISKAKSLLEETDIKMEIISAKVGYMNPKHFFTVFKRFTGVSPLQYRKRNA